MSPLLVCPAGMVLEIGASTHPDEIGLANNEPGAVVSYRKELSSCACEISRIWTATDACANESTCIQILECNCADGDLNDLGQEEWDINYESSSVND